MKQTIQARVRLALEARGYAVTKKLKGCLVMMKDGEPKAYFLGVAGSVRRGGNRASSLPVPNAWKAELIGPAP